MRYPARFLAAAAVLIGAGLTAGCSAITSTTNTAAEAANTVANGISKGSRATTNASVTEPDAPRHQQAAAFVSSQRDALQREAARGGGERVRALAELMAFEQPEGFGPWLQTHYGDIFAEPADAEHVVRRVAAYRG